MNLSKLKLGTKSGELRFYSKIWSRGLKIRLKTEQILKTETIKWVTDLKAENPNREEMWGLKLRNKNREIKLRITRNKTKLKLKTEIKK